MKLRRFWYPVSNVFIVPLYLPLFLPQLLFCPFLLSSFFLFPPPTMENHNQLDYILNEQRFKYVVLINVISSFRPNQASSMLACISFCTGVQSRTNPQAVCQQAFPNLPHLLFFCICLRFQCGHISNTVTPFLICYPS